MLTVTDAELLDLWEWGAYHNIIERALALVALLLPKQPIGELARLPMGQRNRFLLNLRETLFGPLLDLQTACPECTQSLEMQIPIADLTSREDAEGISDLQAEQILESGGQHIHFRLPDSLDLLAAATAPQPRRLLLERCVTQVEAEPPAQGKGAAEIEMPAQSDKAGSERLTLSPETEGLLVAIMQSLDPLANASFALTCPDCGHTWTEPFDIPMCVWTEIDAWAHKTLREIHWLASTYHWSEADILALGPMRRQAYLQMSGYA